MDISPYFSSQEEKEAVYICDIVHTLLLGTWTAFWMRYNASDSPYESRNGVREKCPARPGPDGCCSHRPCTMGPAGRICRFGPIAREDTVTCAA